MSMVSWQNRKSASNRDSRNAGTMFLLARVRLFGAHDARLERTIATKYSSDGIIFSLSPHGDLLSCG